MIADTKIMDRLQNPPEDTAQDAAHIFIVFFVMTCCILMLWAYWGKLDVVSIAAGEVTPSGQVKSVQHLEGGIVREIHVKAGEKVVQGQTLLVLEPTSSAADVNELAQRLVSLEIEITRLKAEIDGADEVTFDADLVKRHPSLVGEAKNIFKTRSARYQSDIQAQRELVKQREGEIAETQARVKNARKSLELLNEQVAISESLLEEELTNRYKHLELLRDQSSMQSRLDEDLAAIKRGNAALAEAKERLETLKLTYQQDAREQMEQSMHEKEELAKRLLKFEDSLDRTVLKAPVDGIVKQLHVHTEGGVVKAGETLLDIVPSDDKLIIEARLEVQDIGYVRVGQPANITLASIDAARFGHIQGEVINISPDTIIDEQDGKAYYSVELETQSSFFEKGDELYHLFPGVQVAANIQTGERRVISYILDPFISSMGQALQER